LPKRPHAALSGISWHPVIKVQHYWLEVDAMAQPMAIQQPVVRYQVKSDDDV